MSKFSVTKCFFERDAEYMHHDFKLKNNRLNNEIHNNMISIFTKIIVIMIFSVIGEP